MSRQHPTDIKCPECGTEVNTIIWSSLNVSVDPDAKKDLLEGKINLFQCTNCDLKSFVPAPVLYHDMNTQSPFCVQYYPFESLEDEEFFDNFLLNGKVYMGHLPKITSANYMEDTHIVFSMLELVQYIIFRDKLIEVKKNSKWNL